VKLFRYYVRLLISFFRYFLHVQQLSFNSLLMVTGSILPFLNRDVQYLKILNSFMIKIVKDRRQVINSMKVPEECCHLDYYLTNSLDGKLFNDEEICAELNTFLMANNDTSKSQLKFLFYFIAKYPKIQQKVYEEVSSFLHNRLGYLSKKDLKDLPYTQSLIYETLRLFPPGPLIARKLDSAITTGGFTFPKGVEVAISPYLMARNPKYFDDPLVFNPDRFLGLDKQPLGFIPFSTGARKCPGEKVGINILKIFVAKICSSFKVSLVKDYSKKLALNMEVVLCPKDKILLTFTEREAGN
jgi:cytochrome P450